MNYKIIRAWDKDLNEIEDVSGMELEPWEIEELEEWDRLEAEEEQERKRLIYDEFIWAGGDPREFESFYEDYE